MPELPAFLAGGFAMGIAVGVVVLFVLRPAVGSAHFTLPRVQIIVGAVLLLKPRVVATARCGPARRRKTCGHLAERRSGPLAAAHPGADQPRVALDRGRRGRRYRAAVRRLSRSAGTHRRLRRRGHRPVRRPAAVQRGGVRVRGDPAARLPGGPGPHPRDPVGAAGVGAQATPTRTSQCCWPLSVRTARSGTGRPVGPRRPAGRIGPDGTARRTRRGGSCRSSWWESTLAVPRRGPRRSNRAHWISRT